MFGDSRVGAAGSIGNGFDVNTNHNNIRFQEDIMKHTQLPTLLMVN